jgi:hypothetical protein
LRERTTDYNTQKRREIEGGKNGDKKILIVKFKMLNKKGEKLRKKKEKKKLRQPEQKIQSVCMTSGFTPLASNPGIGSWCSGLCGKGAAPLVRKLGK